MHLTATTPLNTRELRLRSLDWHLQQKPVGSSPRQKLRRQLVRKELLAVLRSDLRTADKAEAQRQKLELAMSPALGSINTPGSPALG